MLHSLLSLLPPPPACSRVSGCTGLASEARSYAAATCLKALVLCPEILNAWPRCYTYYVASPEGTCEAGYTLYFTWYYQWPFQPAPAQQASIPVPGNVRNAENSVPLRACHTAFFQITKIGSLLNFINVCSFPYVGSLLLFPWSSFSFSFEMCSDFTEYECPTESCLFPNAVNMRGRHMLGRQSAYRI